MSKKLANNSVVAALDVGSTKTCCIIARVIKSEMHVLGYGVNKSRGIKSGVIVNMDEAEKAVRDAVSAAEDAAGVTVDDVYISLSGGHIESEIVYDKIALNSNKPIKVGDTSKLITKALKHLENTDRVTIHRLPIAYDIDGEQIVENPLGMKGDELGVSISSVTSTSVALQALEDVVKRCYLDVSGVVVAPYASGLAALSHDERSLGAVLIEFGGGTIGVSAFLHGHMIRSAILPFGGDVVTNDVARGLRASVSSAERLKTLHGSACSSRNEEDEFLSYSFIGSDKDAVDDGETSKAKLSNIISSRMNEMMDVVGRYLKDNDLEFLLNGSVVLSGGGSQLQRIVELVGSKFKKASVRLAKSYYDDEGVRNIVGLDAVSGGASFLTCVGLLRYAAQTHVKSKDDSGKSGDYNDTKIGAGSQFIDKLKKVLLSGL
ncbi:MAG: cell division protein FtsA [Alphaproteobacteria bacterium]|nr:cell division protein FtsA [Alphaproteobacteria bacterium]